MDVRDFRASCKQSSQDEIKRQGLELYRLYFQKESYFELNITYKDRIQVMERLGTGSIDCFIPAIQHIKGLLLASFSNFKSSQLWNNMNRDLGILSKIMNT